MQTPSRPFESLDWFHDASRRTYRRRGPLGQILTWLRSARAFAFHIGLFALGCTIALAWNVARDPEDIWVDRLALAWTLILVIHAAIAIIVYALGLVGGSEPELPAYRPRQASSTTTWSAPESEARPAPASSAATWGPPPAQPASEPATTATTTGAPAPSRGWSNWSQSRSASTWGATRRPEGETASWAEASPGAVIRRRRNSYMTPGTTSPAGSAGSPIAEPRSDD